MKNKQLLNQLLVSIILVGCYQQIWAGVVVKGARIKNNTKDTNHSIQEPKEAHQIEAILSTTTEKPLLETTTWPSDYNSDGNGRSAFINNEFVAENEQPTVYSSPPLQDVIQQQKPQDYNNDSPQIKEALYNGPIEAEKFPQKPIFGHDIDLFGDYEEEEIGEYGSESDYMPENCEDSQESLGENNDGKDHAVASKQIGYEKEINDNSGPDIFEQDLHNEPDESNSYGLKTNTNQGSLIDKDNTSKYGYQTEKLTEQWYHNHNRGGAKLEIKSNDEYNILNNYDQTKANIQYQQTQLDPLQHYLFGQTNQKPLTNQNSYSKLKPQRNQKPYSNKEKSTQNLVYNPMPTQNSKPYTKQQQTKPGHGLNNKLLYKVIYNNSYNNADSSLVNSDNFNTLTPSSYLPGSHNSSNSSLTPNLSTDNSNTSGRNKNFKTISSSIQYVSTPFADLVFKYSIGMAKLSKSKIGNNSCDSQEQIVNVQNNDNIKSK